MESLLLTGDADIIRTLRPTLEKLSIGVEVCGEARKAGQILVSEKFDAIIVDCDDLRGGTEILRELRTTPSNKNSVAFAVLNGKNTTTQQAFGMGVNFVLQKPVTSLNAARCFTAALSFMERERRRYFRQAIELSVRVILGEEDWKAKSTNISEGGMALAVPAKLPEGCTPRLCFVLPGRKIALDIKSELAWADAHGIAGFRFLDVPPETQELLEQWLAEQIQNG